MLSSQDEFERLSDKSTAEFEERVLDYAYEVARPEMAYDRKMASLERLGRLIAGTSAVAHILGRRRVLMEADEMKKGMESVGALKYAADQNLIPEVPPERAIEDMVKRDPRLAEGYRRVQAVYSEERAFALAKSSDLAITKKVQEVIGNLLQTGGVHPAAYDVISEIGGWAKWYGECVFRTNLNNAYAGGRFAEASDPDLDGFIVGLERMEILDARTRPNHRASHGLTAGTKDPIWSRLGLPGGYNCRGTYRLVDVFEAQRMGLLVNGRMRPADWPHGAYNDDGFDYKTNYILRGGFGG